MSITVFQNRRILVIDDNVEILEDFRKVLLSANTSSALDQARASLFGEVKKESHDESFSVDFAEQGEAGLRLVEQAVGSGKPYALAFVDMRMPPGWDGVETVTRLWQADPDVEVVICTAFSDHAWEDVVTTLTQRDKFLILRKPFDAIEVHQLASSLTRK